ncbi:MAG: hypothetical protein ACM3X6_09300 [Patescibacteria group bacterium]
MKAYEVKRIGAGSVFRFNLCVGFVVGLIAGALLLVMGYSLQDIGIELGTLKGVVGIGAGVVGALLASVLQGILAGVAGAVLAFLYNIFAAAVGGIKVKLVDGG